MRKKKMLAAALLSLSLAAIGAGSAWAGSFVHTPAGVKYRWGDGSFCTNNWVQSHNHWYYFGSDQLMRTGWIQRDGGWYFASDSGELHSGIMKINGNVYYFDGNSCKLVTGGRFYDNGFYRFTENGTVGETPYVYTEWNSNGSLRRGVKASVR